MLNLQRNHSDNADSGDGVMKILVVEDDGNTRTALVAYLQRLGYWVQSAATGKDAIALGTNFRPDLVISDWILEGPCDGIWVAERLLASATRSKVIFITGMPLANLYKRCEHIEVEACFSKPVDLKALGLLINTIQAPARSQP